VGGRFYYAAPLYPMLIAGGSVVGENWLLRRPLSHQKRILAGIGVLLVIGAGLGIALMLPVAPVNSTLWNLTSDIHDNFIDQIGWEEVVETTATIYRNEQRAYQSLGILTSHYGPASAFQLYGDRYSLPTAISPSNSYWLRGYGENQSDAVIAIGFNMESLKEFFNTCRVVGKNANKYKIEKPSSDIYLCEDPKGGWESLWPKLRRFA
jgi:hypothetical protein